MKTKMIRAALAAICVMPIVAWNDSNRPDFSKVEFVKGDDGKKYSLVKKDLHGQKQRPKQRRRTNHPLTERKTTT